MIEEKATSSETQQHHPQVRLRIDQNNMKTSYANAFQSNATPDELFLNFGINQALPSQNDGQDAELLLNLENRIIMNFHTAKRLAIALTQAVRQHEQQFGELELDITKRMHPSVNAKESAE